MKTLNYSIKTFSEIQALAKQCGNYAMARYMQKNGYSLETALYILRNA